LNSMEFPLLDRTTQIVVISTTSNDVSNYFITSLSMELLDRDSTLIVMDGLVPNDLILTASTVTMKMAPSLV
jgi:hypothetical protein